MNLWIAGAPDRHLLRGIEDPEVVTLVVALGWKRRRNSRTTGSPHPCRTYGVARPAEGWLAQRLAVHL